MKSLITLSFIAVFSFISFTANAQNHANFETLIASLQDKDSKTIVYTVQVGAFKESPKDGYFNGLEHLFSSFYEDDSFTRFYTGLFKSLPEAKAYKEQIREKGFTNAFVLGLDGGFDRTFVKMD